MLHICLVNVLELLTWPINKYQIWCWKYQGMMHCSSWDKPAHLIRWSTESNLHLAGTVSFVTSLLRTWTTILFSLRGLTRTMCHEWWKLMNQSISTGNITVMPNEMGTGCSAPLRGRQGDAYCRNFPTGWPAPWKPGGAMDSTWNKNHFGWLGSIWWPWTTWPKLPTWHCDTWTEFCWPHWCDPSHKQH